MYHYRYSTQINLFCLVFLDQVRISCPWLISISFPLFNMEINFTIYLICKVSDSCLVGIIRIKISSSFISQSRFWLCVDLTKNGLIANGFNIMIPLAGNILPVNFDNIWLVLFDTVGDGMLDKLVEWLNLLVHHTVLIKESINDLPLIINIYLVLSTQINVKLIQILLYFLVLLFW